ncbi:NADH-quinone oxidoreductase subunit C [Gracilimonas mengyeensis]|uniref:NADH-quinone oxidoreductase subunit C n=1 Tax=Gracilimonas mengyeensis TaxID=1302730 RepID=A0A521AHZ4_9BACT|nr:NADH-quinone oxidoreductase subunit C [Gracilimonas mengyeensis]SMO34465.1 NADH dehydrogenase subunit C [Gracilimonas mengyeensis]
MSLNLNETEQAVVDGLSDKFSDDLIEVYQSCDHTYIRMEADNIVDICRYLKTEQHFIFLCDILGTDRYTSDERFEVIYNMMNLRTQDRIFIKIRVEEENPVVHSVTSVWKSASWYEREVYDMFGVRFEEHPDLRRIFMPEDFEYFPLRKEFPLLGIPGSIALPDTTPDTE